MLIDGYNLIKHLSGSKQTSQSERDRFVREIAGYLKNRDVTGYIVFDGGSTAYPEKHAHGVFTVIYAGYKTIADDYIVHFIKQHKEYEILVVTDDRQLRDRVTGAGKHILRTYDFYHDYVKEPLKKTAASGGAGSIVKKLTQESTPELDALMEQASAYIPHKSEDHSDGRQSSGYKISKKERAQERVLDKLRSKYSTNTGRRRI